MVNQVRLIDKINLIVGIASRLGRKIDHSKALEIAERFSIDQLDAVRRAMIYKIVN